MKLKSQEWITKCTDSQRAVWRNGGSNPAESDVRTRTAVARRTCSVSRRFAKPPSRWVQAGERAVDKAVKTRTLSTI